MEPVFRVIFADRDSTPPDEDAPVEEALRLLRAVSDEYVSVVEQVRRHRAIWHNIKDYASFAEAVRAVRAVYPDVDFGEWFECPHVTGYRVYELPSGKRDETFGYLRHIHVLGNSDSAE
jgi:hypothetical protein